MRKTPKQVPRYLNGPTIIDDEMREQYPALGEQDLVLLECDQTHGEGYGVEPYGYQLTHLKTIHRLEEECDCGSNESIYEYSGGRATCSPASVNVTCNKCGKEIRNEYWD